MKDLDIQNYVQIKFEDFKKVIDRLGGLDVELTKSEIKYINNKLHTDDNDWKNDIKAEMKKNRKKLRVAHVGRAHHLPVIFLFASRQQEVAAASSGAATHLRACLAAASRWRRRG